jgi:hypothetical protein
MNRFFKSVCAGALVLMVLGGAAPAYANHAWGSYHWAHTATPFTLTLGDAVTPAWDSYVSLASTEWSTSVVLDTTLAPSAVNPKTCKATTGRIEVCNAKYGNTGWLGIATIWADANGHITKATTKLNDTYFVTPTYNTPAWKRLVSCQEIAHDFGLAHQDETFTNVNLGSCMDYTNAPAGGVVGNFNYGPTNEYPNAHDFDQLLTIYSHNDTYTTINTTAAQIRALAKSLIVVDDEDDDLGEPVGHNAKGTADEFMKVYGNGSTKLTHVFWLPE